MNEQYIIYRETKDGPLFMSTFVLATQTSAYTSEYPDAGFFTELQAQAITEMVVGTKAMKAQDYGFK